MPHESHLPASPAVSDAALRDAAAQRENDERLAYAIKCHGTSLMPVGWCTVWGLIATSCPKCHAGCDVWEYDTGARRVLCSGCGAEWKREKRGAALVSSLGPCPHQVYSAKTDFETGVLMLKCRCGATAPMPDAPIAWQL